MSGGFFRGTSADQDTRFSNKQAKLMKSQKFAAELENLVDTSKVKMDVMRPWIAHRVTELLGFEDEVLINFIYGLLEEKLVNGKEIQISLTGFMERNTGKFMKELWTHLLSAQKNASGVPQEFLDAKAEEARKKKEESDRITSEIQKKKEKEGQELEQERMKKMDGAVLEPSSRHQARDSSARSVDEKDVSGRNGSRGRPRVSRSPHPADLSPASPRRKPSRSISNSPKSRNLVNGRLRSRSISVSPQPGQRSGSSGKVHRSPSRQSLTPHQKDSLKLSPSSPMREPSQLRRRSVSRSRHRSPSPVRRRLRSPMRRRSRSPMRRRSRSPIRRNSRSPLRRRSQSPIRRRSRSPIRRRSRSPIRRRSRSPVRRRSRSPVRRRRSRSPVRRRSRSPVRRRSRSPLRYRSRSPVRRRSRSPLRYRSRSPVRRRSRSPVRRRSRPPFTKSPSPVRHGSQSPSGSSSPTRLRSASLGQGRSLSPIGRESSSPVQRLSPSPIRRRSPSSIRRRSPSPVQWRSPSPVRWRSPSPVRRKSPSPLQRRSRSPMRRRYRGAPSSPLRRSPSPFRRRPSMISRRRSPSPGHRSPPLKKTSQSPIDRAPGRRSPKRQWRSPLQSPTDSLRYSPGRSPPAREKAYLTVEFSKGSGASERRPPVSAMSPQRDLGDRNGFRKKVPARSPSPLSSPSNSESPTAARKRSTIEDSRVSSPESPVKQIRARVIHVDRNDKPIRDSPASAEYEKIRNAREEDKMPKSSGKRNVHLSTAEEQKLSVGKAYYRKEPSPERLATRHSGEVWSRADNNESKRDQKSKSDNIAGRASYPELTEQGSPRTFKGALPNERVRKGNSVEEYKADERNHSRPNDTKGNARPDDLEKVSKLSRKIDANDQSCSVDSGSEESDEQRAEVKDKKKHRRSKTKDVASDCDDSYFSHIEDKREAKRRRKEEKRSKKEERRRRRAERRRRREERHAEKQKVKSVGNSSPLSDSDKNHGGSDSEGERVAKKESRATNSDDAVSEQKKLEIELREKALQSLRVKKGAGH